MSDITDTEVQNENVQFSCTVKYLDTFIDSVSSFREEGKLVFNDEYVYTKVNDPANVAMCIARIKGQALNSLDVTGSDKISVGLNFERILDCLSGVPGTSDIEVTYPVSSGGNLLMRLDVIDEDLTFEVNTLDPSTVPDIPDIDPLSHKSRINVGGSEIKSTITHADKMVSKDDSGILFRTKSESLKVSTSDKTEGNFKKEFYNTDPSVDGSLGKHKTTISISYLKDIKNILSKGESVVVHIKEDNPVRFDVNLDSAGDAQIIYIIAPRLESD